MFGLNLDGFSLFLDNYCESQGSSSTDWRYKGAFVMGMFFKVAKVSDIPEGTAQCVWVNNQKIALYHIEGVFYATQDTCTHANASLSEGDIVGEEIECPLHGARFSVKTGEPTAAPGFVDLEIFSVRVVGEDIEVEV